MSTTQIWLDLDNEKISFLTIFRPRPTYLYFQYIQAVLSLSYSSQTLHPHHKGEISKPYWGTAGSWMREAYIRAFAEEIGHDLSGYIGDLSPEGESDPTLLAISNDSITRLSHREDEEEDQEEVEEVEEQEE